MSLENKFLKHGGTLHVCTHTHTYTAKEPPASLVNTDESLIGSNFKA